MEGAGQSRGNFIFRLIDMTRREAQKVLKGSGREHKVKQHLVDSTYEDWGRSGVSGLVTQPTHQCGGSKETMCRKKRKGAMG